MIRTAKTSDIDNLVVLSIQVWMDTYAIQGIRHEYSQFVLAEFSHQAFEQLLNNPQVTLLLDEKDGVLRGYAALNTSSPCPVYSADIELSRLYVHAKWQGLGIGRALLQACQDRVRGPLWLRTWRENKANQFYESARFKLIGEEQTQFGSHPIVNNIYVSNTS